MKYQKGFSLIELLIVVVVIGIIAAIAIPNLLASRRTSNEGSAIATMRLVIGAQSTYATSYGNGFYADNLVELGSHGIIDGVVGCPADPCSKSGYNFAIDRDNGAGYPPNWNVFGTPVTATGPAATGTKSFYSNETGVIYYKSGGEAPTAGLTETVRIPTDGIPLGQ